MSGEGGDDLAWAERLVRELGVEPMRERAILRYCCCALTNDDGRVTDRCCAPTDNPDSPLCNMCINSGHDRIPHVPYTEILRRRKEREVESE